MKYFVEDSLGNFQFWSGGKDRADLLTSEQFDTVEQMMEEIEPADGWSDTAINDFSGLTLILYVNGWVIPMRNTWKLILQKQRLLKHKNGQKKPQLITIHYSLLPG